MTSLRKSHSREPLTWWRAGDTVRVVCSRGHASHVRHDVTPSGALVAPVGRSPSMHCGTCNEDLPLRLDEWAP